jgi:hypothetical protein
MLLDMVNSYKEIYPYFKEIYNNWKENLNVYFNF